MELRRLLAKIRQRKLLIVVIALAALAAGYSATSRVALYRATATLYVGIPENVSSTFFNGVQQTGTELAAATFSKMVATPTVISQALTSSGEPRSVGQVYAETRAGVVPNTDLILVSVTDPDPVVARALANGVADAFVSQITKLQPVQAVNNDGVPTGPITSPVAVFELAGIPGAPL